MKSFGTVFLGLFVWTVFHADVMGQTYSSGQKEILALRAAKVDAYRRLLAIIEGYRIESQTTVRDFVVANDEIRSRLDGYIRGAKEVSQRIEPDGTAVIEVEVQTKEIERILGKKLGISEGVIRATGFGAPPGDTSRQTAPSSSPFTWSNPVIRVTGQGAYPTNRSDLSAGQAQLMAKRAAELDAYRKISEELYGMRIRSDTTVRDFVVAHDTVQSNLTAFIRGAFVESERNLGDLYEVTMVLDTTGLPDLISLPR